MSRPTLEKFFENAIRNAGRPPFKRVRFLAVMPRDQQGQTGRYRIPESGNRKGKTP